MKKDVEPADHVPKAVELDPVMSVASAQLAPVSTMQTGPYVVVSAYVAAEAPPSASAAVSQLMSDDDAAAFTEMPSRRRPLPASWLRYHCAMEQPAGRSKTSR